MPPVTPLPHIPSRSSSWRDLAADFIDILAVSRSRDWFFVERSHAQDCLPEEVDVADLIADLDRLLDEADHPARIAAQLRATHVPRTGPLVALLCLARTFETRENFWATLTSPAAILLLSTSELEHEAHVVELLDALLHAECVETERVGRTKPVICKIEDAAQGSSASGQSRRGLNDLSLDLQHALESRAPVILIGALQSLLNPLQALSVHHIPLVPLDHEILGYYLHQSFPNRAGATSAVIRKSLEATKPEMLSLMDLMIAARAGSALEAAAILCARAPASVQNIEFGRLQDFPLPQNLHATLAQMIEDLALWRNGQLPWSDVVRGLLLHGPTGSGKTEIARLIAREAGIVLHAGSLVEWMSRGARGGDAIREMRKFFDRAAADAPCILFIDEIDALGNRARPHDHNSSWTDGLVTSFLTCVDGFEQQEGVISIAATNHLEKLDAAILRPGRFDQVFRLDYPSRDQLPRVFRWHLKSDLPDADLTRLSGRAFGLSGAMIGAVVRDARARARRQKHELKLEDLEMALSEHRPELPQDHRRVIAVHEAGHAIVAAATGAFKPVVLAILSDGGVTEQAPTQNIICRRQIDAEIQTLLAGRAAEKLVFGEISAGSGGHRDSDLARATERVAAADLSYGLGAGPIWLGTPDEMIIHLWRDPALCLRTRERLAALEVAATRILAQNRQVLADLATALERAGVIEEAELNIYLSRLQPTARDCRAASLLDASP